MGRKKSKIRDRQVEKALIRKTIQGFYNAMKSILNYLLTNKSTRCKLYLKMKSTYHRLKGDVFMVEYRLTEAEEKFAEIIWDNEPIKSPDLVRLAEEAFNWKKSTTYTMLKRLEEKNIFKNNKSLVVSLIKKEDFYSEQSKIFVQENFGGSLPKFVAAFTKKNKLSNKEVKELVELINNHKED